MNDEAKNDPINPSHYRSHPSGVECIEVTRHMTFNTGNAIKYIWRNGLKVDEGKTGNASAIQDLKKAIWYLDDEIKRLDKISGDCGIICKLQDKLEKPRESLAYPSVLEFTLPYSKNVDAVFRWCYIPPGKGIQGSNKHDLKNKKSWHLVINHHGYYMLEAPITQLQYAALCRDVDVNPKTLNYPVTYVSWNKAAAYCIMLQDRLPAGLKNTWLVSLPTESQWEYACRAGSGSEYCNGDGAGRLREVGWFDGNSHNQTHPVKQKNPNAWGLYDMHGNVWEWCRDAWKADAYESRSDSWDVKEWVDGDPNAPRVVRGGSNENSAMYCRSAFRYWWRPYRVVDDIGFRPCLIPTTTPS